MTEKKLRDKVLLSIYKRRNNLNINSELFCKEEKIGFENNVDQNRIFKFLSDKGYIQAIFFETGNCNILSITSAGIDYVEEHFTRNDTLADDKAQILAENNYISNPEIDNNNISIVERLISQSQALIRQINAEKDKKIPDFDTIYEITGDLKKIEEQIISIQTQREAYRKQASIKKVKGENSDQLKVTYSKSLSTNANSVLNKLKKTSADINKQFISLNKQFENNISADKSDGISIQLPLTYLSEESMYLPAKEEMFSIKTTPP